MLYLLIGLIFYATIYLHLQKKKILYDNILIEGVNSIKNIYYNNDVKKFEFSKFYVATLDEINQKSKYYK